ncbi:MAG: ABC transporter ATP-binding protein [Clostridia bacterium]|nr:ABC transporter ATP-binding protein [Clostridia bacterium]
MLKVKDLQVSYDGMVALRDVSIQVNEGELLAIVGSNGAGKTTLLNTISGIIRADKGSIEFMGERIDKLEPFEIVNKGVVQVPEGRKLFPRMTVMENLEMGAYGPQASSQISETMEVVFELLPRLKDRAKQYAGTLSGGEQQMVAIGRALMARPRLLMLDEPSLGLAPKIVDLVLKTVIDINKQGTTVVLIEQNVAYSLNICSRAYVLENGAIVLEGKGCDLLGDEHVKKAYLGI